MTTCLVNLISKDTHLVFSIYKPGSPADISDNNGINLFWEEWNFPLNLMQLSQDCPLYILMVHRSNFPKIFSIVLSLKMGCVLPNSVNPDAFHLGHHFLPKYFLGVSSIQRILKSINMHKSHGLNCDMTFSRYTRLFPI